MSWPVADELFEGLAHNILLFYLVLVLCRWAGTFPDELGLFQTSRESQPTILYVNIFRYFPHELAPVQMSWPCCGRPGWGAGPHFSMCMLS